MSPLYSSVPDDEIIHAKTKDERPIEASRQSKKGAGAGAGATPQHTAGRIEHAPLGYVCGRGGSVKPKPRSRENGMVKPKPRSSENGMAW